MVVVDGFDGFLKVGGMWNVWVFYYTSYKFGRVNLKILKMLENCLYYIVQDISMK